MSDNNNRTSHDDFQLVKNRKKSRKNHQNLTNLINLEQVPVRFDEPTVIRRLEAAIAELPSSDLFQSVKASIREALDCTRASPDEVQEIVCFGIGRLSSCLISRYQFALLVSLRDWFGCSAKIYDPVLTENDERILGRFQCELLTGNCEGKWQARDGKTVFFLPHCPKQLSNNLLWANWDVRALSRCVIVANSFASILERSSSKVVQAQANYVRLISPYVRELAVINNFRFYEVFNDLAVHCFPDLGLIDEDFWAEPKEPKYQSADVEFVRK